MNEVKLLGLEGGEFVANATTAGDQRTPSVTKLASGGFVVVWTDASDADGPNGTDVKAQVYDAFGARVGGEILVNTVTGGDQMHPAVAALASGGFVVSWASGSDGRAQVFDAAGAKLGGEIAAFIGYGGYQPLDLTGLAGGGFVLTAPRGLG